MLNLSKQTIEKLRKTGYKCKIHHYRDMRDVDGVLLQNIPLMDIHDGRKICSTGGKTELFITTPEGNHYKGAANCNPKDSFNYKISVKICLGRLQEIKPEEIKEYLT